MLYPAQGMGIAKLDWIFCRHCDWDLDSFFLSQLQVAHSEVLSEDLGASYQLVQDLIMHQCAIFFLWNDYLALFRARLSRCSSFVCLSIDQFPISSSNLLVDSTRLYSDNLTTGLLHFLAALNFLNCVSDFPGLPFLYNHLHWLKFNTKHKVSPHSVSCLEQHIDDL